MPLAAPSGMVIGGIRVRPFLRAVVDQVLEDNVLGMAAQTAYFFFFSLFPLLLFLTPLFSLVGDQESIVAFIIDQLRQTVPPDAMALIEGVVENVVFTENAPGLMSVGAVLALWAGSNIFNNLIVVLNRAYDVQDTRPFWKRRLIAIGMVLVSGLIVLLATVTFVAGRDIVLWAGDLIGLDRTATLVWIVAQYTIALLFVTAGAWLIYNTLPATRQSKRQVLVGAVVATVLWVLITLGFRYYVMNFGNYNATYGTIGGVIVLLTWMYLTMLALLIGGEVNSELHKGTAAVETRGGKLYGERVSSGGEVAVPSVERVVKVGE